MANIHDIAKKAGVSVTTVSRVLNNYPYVSKEKKEAVLFLFTFLGLKYLKRYKIASLVNMKKLTYLLLLTFRGLVLYTFQLITDFDTQNQKTH